MKYNMEFHHGDDNDNFINRFEVEAATKDALFDTLEKAFFNAFQGDRNDVTIDGDENSLTILWFHNDIPFHHDYYIMAD